MYKVWVVADSSGTVASNQLEFETVDKAYDYGVDLASRWFLVNAFYVIPSSAPLEGHPSIEQAKEYAVKERTYG